MVYQNNRHGLFNACHTNSHQVSTLTSPSDSNNSIKRMWATTRVTNTNEDWACIRGIALDLSASRLLVMSSSFLCQSRWLFVEVVLWFNECVLEERFRELTLDLLSLLSDSFVHTSFIFWTVFNDLSGLSKTTFWWVMRRVILNEACRSWKKRVSQWLCPMSKRRAWTLFSPKPRPSLASWKKDNKPVTTFSTSNKSEFFLKRGKGSERGTTTTPELV